MASAGVVGMAEIVQPNSSMGRTSAIPVSTWSFIWVGIALFILVFLHLAMMGRGR